MSTDRLESPKGLSESGDSSKEGKNGQHAASAAGEDPKGPSPGKAVDIDEHLIGMEAVCKRYGVVINEDKAVDSQGLSEEEVQKRLAADGPNILSPPKKRHPILKFLDCLKQLFNVLLIISGILCFILFFTDRDENESQSIVGSVLIGVALANALIEFVQIQKSQSILNSFMNLVPSKSYAIRNGKLTGVAAQDLVVGDVVFVRMGDKVPADIVIFASTEMKVDNAALTGEAEPQERSKSNSNENPLEATNLMFNGTLAVNGEAYGIVVRTGDRTVLGQIAGLTANEEKRQSPMSIEIDGFVKKIAFAAFVVAVVFLLVGIIDKKMPAGTAINFAIGTFVSFVPEGLPATVTVLLTIAAKRMAGRNVLVKDLQGVETLGAITLLATDKTGTLTRNQMTVTYIWTGMKIFFALNSANNSNAPEDMEQINRSEPGVEELINMSALCAKAKFDRTDVPVAERQILGDATESGLIKFAATQLDNFDEMNDVYPKVFEIPFNSDNKWHLTIHEKKHDNGSLTMYMKGAPERILRLCDKIFTGTEVVPLSEEHRKKWQEIYEFMASKGHRVLAFANLYLDGNTYPEDFAFSKDPVNYPTGGLIFHALVSLEDPPKHGVREAIGHCREAGIQVMMVTGDHPLTAEAIGRKINLMLQDTKPMVAQKTGRALEEIGEDEYNAVVVHGEQIDRLTDEDWENIFNKEEIIFARTSPKHKLQIVKRAQARGHIVGVTGDGVNDSPALKKADLGIAMNQSGSDVSKEAAAMILLDDNFASTVSGIEEGRLIFTNLKKTIQYTVTHTMPQALANLLYTAVPIPLPLATLLIIVTDLGFELFHALSFAWDPAETRTGLMKLPPRKPVTPASVERLRREEARKPAPKVDAESGAVIPFSASDKLKEKVNCVKRVFSREYWSEAFEDTEDETLIDGNLLSYSYLEVGIIMTIGCLVSFFTVLYDTYGITPADAVDMAKLTATEAYKNKPFFTSKADPYTLASGKVISAEDQVDAFRQGNGIYYIGMFIMQAFNLFVCKARLNYPFGKYMFGNWRNFAGIGLGAITVAFFAYVPGVTKAFETSENLSPLYWLIPMAFGVFIVFYGSLRIWILKRARPVKFSREVIGLQMFPARWSTKGSGH